MTGDNSLQFLFYINICCGLKDAPLVSFCGCTTCFLDSYYSITHMILQNFLNSIIYLLTPIFRVIFTVEVFKDNLPTTEFISRADSIIIKNRWLTIKVLEFMSNSRFSKWNLGSEIDQVIGFTFDFIPNVNPKEKNIDICAKNVNDAIVQTSIFSLINSYIYSENFLNFSAPILSFFYSLVEPLFSYLGVKITSKNCDLIAKILYYTADCFFLIFVSILFYFFSPKVDFFRSLKYYLPDKFKGDFYYGILLAKDKWDFNYNEVTDLLKSQMSTLADVHKRNYVSTVVKKHRLMFFLCKNLLDAERCFLFLLSYSKVKPFLFFFSYMSGLYIYLNCWVNYIDSRNLFIYLSSFIPVIYPKLFLFFFICTLHWLWRSFNYTTYISYNLHNTYLLLCRIILFFSSIIFLVSCFYFFYFNITLSHLFETHSGNGRLAKTIWYLNKGYTKNIHVRDTGLNSTFDFAMDLDYPEYLYSCAILKLYLYIFSYRPSITIFFLMYLFISTPKIFFVLGIFLNHFSIKLLTRSNVFYFILFSVFVFFNFSLLSVFF